ncbi:FxSxx-COOH system tetratricopeptide repeat protein [Streptomyces fuscichromogenes]|uniref:FxSxx-COOH system tetratricopeptide repeat protein n=1 Tax=Streptomyces fuscichromogenes TaxID=1324013 RepID=UPI003804BEAB
MTAESLPGGTHIQALGPRSIAAGIIGTAVTGDVVLPAEALNAARDIEAPPGTSNLPPQGLCLGREDELAWLRNSLVVSNGTAITQVLAVHGLGGVGKSTLALAYAHRHRSDYALTWWVTADSSVRIEQSLAGLALRLFPSWAGRASEHEQFQWTMNWLQWHPGWLLIFDNVENPRDLAPYTGALNRGQHLATSRRVTGWPRTTPTRALGTLSANEAGELLCVYALDGTTPTVHQRQESLALASELGYLPLALEQAGAYLNQNPTVSIDAYRKRLATKLDKAADGINAERTIARVWSHTLEVLNSSNQLAVRLLYILAWLAPDSIPVGLIEIVENDSDEIAEALGALRAYSMISFSPDRTSVSIHRLVQVALRSNTASGLAATGRREAEEVILHSLPVPSQSDVELPPEWDLLTPHLIALAASAPHSQQNESIVTAYTFAAKQLYSQGYKASTIPLREAIFNYFKSPAGESDNDTILAQSNLAASYESAGDMTRAVAMYEESLRQCEETFGQQHPKTLIVRGNLAGAYESAGYVTQAISLYKKVLKQSIRVFGEDDPETLTMQNNLAYAYRVTGNLKRAIPLYKATLSQRTKTLGSDHPSTLNSLNNLATAYQAAGDLQQATPLLESVLTQHERVLGKDHPQTMTVRNNLGIAYSEAKEMKRAIAILEPTLAQREQFLGNIHPDTLQSRNNLATAYLMSGELKHGLPMLETVHAQYERILGETHPLTINTRHNLASGYQAAGQSHRAVTLLETTLAQSEDVFGRDHPDTMAARYSLAYARRQQDAELRQRPSSS